MAGPGLITFTFTAQRLGVCARRIPRRNWGAGFPLRWFWLQCNTFEGQPDVALTAVGATRRLVQPYGGYGERGAGGALFAVRESKCLVWLSYSKSHQEFTNDWKYKSNGTSVH